MSVMKLNSVVINGAHFKIDAYIFTETHNAAHVVVDLRCAIRGGAEMTSGFATAER